MERLLYRIPEASDVLGFKRSKAYRLIHAGELKAIRVGKVLRIPADELRAYVERAKTETTAGK